MARKILLADDSVTAQNMGRRILTDAGYEVVTVNNGSAALKKLAEQRPDLIVLDVYMPGYGGLEVCQRVKENKETARIPVLLTVGKLEPFKPEEARRVRADAFIVKPFEASELLTALTKLEDKIVPQAEPYKPGRFAKALASVERSADAESFGDKETGWKNRLIIPGPGAKSSEPEAEIPASATTAFRDVERNKDFQPAGPKSEFERPIPAGLPLDITPEEIAAITAAAATFGGRIEAPASQPEAVVQPQEISAATTPVAETASAPASESEQTEPVERSESTIETPAAAFASAPETQPAELPVVAAEVSSAEVSSTVEAAASTESNIVNATFAAAEASAVVAESEASKTESQAESQPAPVKFDALEAEKKRAVSDPEVLAALASLGIPADAVVGSSRTSGEAGEEVGVAATVAKAELVAVGASASGPRWMAVATALSPDESSMMLEHEMEKAYAAFAAAAGARTTFGAAPVTIAGGNGSSTLAESSSMASPDSSSASSGSMASPDSSSASSGSVVESKPEESSVAAVSEPVASAPETAEPVKNDPAPASETTTEAVAASASEPAPAVKEEAAFAAAASASAAPAEAGIVNESVQAVSSSSQPTGGHDPQREAELAAAWANWKPTHEPSAGSQTTSPEAAATPATQEPEKHESSPTPTPEASSDSTEISSIVDNMLAELKPRLMEEIARKMGNEKKKDKKNKR